MKACEVILEKHNPLRRVGLTAEQVRALTTPKRVMRLPDLPPIRQHHHDCSEKMRFIEEVAKHLKMAGFIHAVDLAEQLKSTRQAVGGAIRRMMRAGWPVEIFRPDRTETYYRWTA
jgi:biotin operon repressor